MDVILDENGRHMVKLRRLDSYRLFLKDYRIGEIKFQRRGTLSYRAPMSYICSVPREIPNGLKKPFYDGYIGSLTKCLSLIMRPNHNRKHPSG